MQVLSLDEGLGKGLQWLNVYSDTDSKKGLVRQTELCKLWLKRLGLVQTTYAVWQSNSLIPFSVSLQVCRFVITVIGQCSKN